VRLATQLLQLLLGLLAARGLAAEGLGPWRAWVVFKQFARVSADVPDPGVSVQIEGADDGAARLVFVRQVVVEHADWLEPAGGVVCELVFPQGGRPLRDQEYWSFDFPSFERFVDVVEQAPDFQELLGRVAARSDVYLAEA
jgi:hypothetical protein